LRALYIDDWYNRTDFEVLDAAVANKIVKYLDRDNKDFTHIYSYNKVMSYEDRRGICKILNRTNYKILAWYFGPKDTE
jgi:DNA-directed RNA polymerase subunit F